MLHDIRILALLLLLSPTLSCQKMMRQVSSPSGICQVTIDLNKAGEIFYKVDFHGKTVIDWSQLGLKDKTHNLSSGFTLRDATVSSHDSSWKPVWGEVAEIRDHYTELEYRLRNADSIEMIIRFNVFDDGVGFRYEIPSQPGITELLVTDEVTTFQMTGDHTAWWIPGDYDSNEHVYSTSKVSEIDCEWHNQNFSIHTQHIVKMKNVQTPLTMRTQGRHPYQPGRSGPARLWRPAPGNRCAKPQVQSLPDPLSRFDDQKQEPTAF